MDNLSSSLDAEHVYRTTGRVNRPADVVVEVLLLALVLGAVHAVARLPILPAHPERYVIGLAIALLVLLILGRGALLSSPAGAFVLCSGYCSSYFFFVQRVVTSNPMGWQAVVPHVPALVVLLLAVVGQSRRPDAEPHLFVSLAAVAIAAIVGLATAAVLLLVSLQMVEREWSIFLHQAMMILGCLGLILILSQFDDLGRTRRLATYAVVGLLLQWLVLMLR